MASTRGRAASAPRWCPGAAAPPGSSSTRCWHPWGPYTSRAPASHLHGHSTSPSPSSLHLKMGSSAKGGPSGVLELPCLSAKDRRPPRAPSSPLLPGHHPCPRTRGCQRRGALGRRCSHPCAAREPSASPPTQLRGVCMARASCSRSLLPSSLSCSGRPPGDPTTLSASQMPTWQRGAGVLHPPHCHGSHRWDTAGPGQRHPWHGSRPGRGFLDTATLETATKNILPPTPPHDLETAGSGR